MPRITQLNIYPVKSCGGVALDEARLTTAGFDHDREWMIVRNDGRFVTQREEPRLALLAPTASDEGLTLRQPSGDMLQVPNSVSEGELEVVCWRDRCAAFDTGVDAARWLSAYLGYGVKLVRFDARRPRPSDPAWAGDVLALNRFTDAFPFLLISQGSLDELNSRLPTPLPMNRFRPNIVIDSTEPYVEDATYELRIGDVALRPVKPCTRCIITTTDQIRGERDGEEPLRTLKQYRFDATLKGVAFGQNLVLARGAGEVLRVGQEVDVTLRA